MGMHIYRVLEAFMPKVELELSHNAVRDLNLLADHCGASCGLVVEAMVKQAVENVVSDGLLQLTEKL